MVFPFNVSRRGESGTRSTVLLAEVGFNTVIFPEEHAVENVATIMRIKAADHTLSFTLDLHFQVRPVISVSEVKLMLRYPTTIQNESKYYTSGPKLCAPINVLGSVGCTGTGTFANRVPGEPLFSADLNEKNVDPNATFFLNPDAWEDPPAGQYGTSAAYYDDYHRQRRPSESMSLGRIFRVGERANLNIRIEFSNIFNRTQKTDPSSTNAAATQRVDANGKPLSGFGYINTGMLGGQPRTGQLVARFQF
jgi:hypothetical protein